MLKIMKSKYTYLLNECTNKRELIYGIYSSFKALKLSLIKLDKKKMYKVYKIPLNKLISRNNKNGNDFKNYLYYNFGTFKELYIETDNGKIIKEKNRKVVFWQ